MSPKHALAAACPFVDGSAPDTDGNAANNVILITGSYTVTADNSNLGNFDCSAYDIHVSTGGVLTLESYSNISNGTFHGVNMSVHNLTVDNGGIVTASGKGWAGGAANADGYGLGKGFGVTGNKSANGGGFGGYVGNPDQGGATYGNPYNPIELGSGGGGADGLAGGAGGGAIKFVASGDILVNAGFIHSDGIAATSTGTFPNMICSGSGSGGSIWLTGAHVTLQNNGFVTANGGDAVGLSGNCPSGGAGGRILFSQLVDVSLVSAQTGYTGSQSKNGTILPQIVGINENDSVYNANGLTRVPIGGTTTSNHVQLVTSLTFDSQQSFGVAGTLANNAVSDPVSPTTSYSLPSVSIYGSQHELLAVYLTYHGTETATGIELNNPDAASQSFVKACSSSVNDLHSEIWYVMNPNVVAGHVNSDSVVTSFTGSGVSHLGIETAEFYDVDPTNPIASAHCNQSVTASTHPTVLAAPTGSQLAFGGVAVAGTTPPVPDSTSWQLNSQAGTTIADSIVTKTKGNSINWESASATNWATSSIVINGFTTLTPITYHYQAEVQPLGTAFTDTPNLTTPFSFDSRFTEMAFPFVAPSTGSYHWQARICDSNDANCTAWFSYAYNPESSADFVVSTLNNAPSSPSSLGPTNVTDGSSNANQQPTLNFDLSDPDGADQVQYQIQVASDSAFTAPVIEYTSALGAQGPASFTVGQAAGSGTYVYGQSGQTLANGSYYWRVKTIDQYDVSSAFVAANSGAVAFVENGGAVADTTPPSLNFTTSAAGNVLVNAIQYVGTATDETAMASVEYAVDGGARQNANPTTTNPLSYPFSIDLTSLNLSLGGHSVVIYADDASSNETSQSFSITVVADNVPPVFSFTASPSAYVKNPVVVTGTATDETAMSAVSYTVDGGTRTDAVPDTSNPLSYSFSNDFSYLADGAHTVEYFAKDAANNETSQTFSFHISRTAPSCTAGWMNQPVPMYSAILPYTNVHCTGPIPIVSAAYSMYHNSFGTIVGATPVTSVSGVASTDETYNFNVDLTGFGNIDGTMEVFFIVTDAAGNTSYDYDPVTLAATDTSAPTINFDQITPNPLTDTQPTITGSCRDDTPLAKNTFISNMNYSIDGGSNIDIDPLDHSYNDAYTKNFSVKLATLALGNHTVALHCTDGSSNTSTSNQTFSIVVPTNPTPGTFNYTENFTTTQNQDIPNSDNMIWGNGKLRLKEDITTTRTLINSTGHCALYADCRDSYGVWQDPVDSNKLYYVLGGNIYIYNIQTQNNSLWDYESEFGVGNFGPPTIFSLGVFQGKEYLWMANTYGLSIFNLTDHTHIDKPYTNVNGIETDYSRGRLAAYIQGDAAAGYTNLAYLDLNGTLLDQSDDVYTRIPTSTINTTGFLFSKLNPHKNLAYWSSYNDGLYVWDDHNNPADVAHYTVTHYTGYQFGNVWSMTFDPNENVIFGTNNNGNQAIYEIDDHGNPLDSSQSTINQIATNRQLGYKGNNSLQYIVGQNGVGDQLFISTDIGDPTYFNFNSNYTNTTDKTFISLPIVNGLRPDVVNLFMTDYNTGYALIRNQGFFKIDLHRGWASSGAAVSLPPRPSQALVVDNFVANANPGATIAYLPGSNSPMGLMAKIQRALVPTALASGGTGIQYFVSTDGGVTWTEVTLGQLQQLQSNDYRVKFKIVMTPVNGASPVLDSYSLAYAGYASPAQQGATVGLGVSASSNTPTAGNNFSVTVQGVDIAGYLTPTYTGHVVLSLVDANSLSPVSGLSASTADITSGGTITLDGVQIAQPGTFKIKATDGNYTNYSVPITVGAASSLTQPTLNFWSDSYTITSGQSVALHWSSSNVTSWTIQPGNVTETSSSGNYVVKPTQTTTYTFTASGPHGAVTNSVTIVVTNGAGGNGSSNSGNSNSGIGSSLQSSGSATSTTGGVGTTPGSSSLAIFSSPDQTVIKGEKATITWTATNADQVTVDYPTLHTVGTTGSFEFYPTSSLIITLTATKNQITSTKTITITVLDAPIQVQQAVKNLQELFPGIVPFLNITFKSSQTVPKVGLGAFAAVEAAIMTLLLTSIASQIGFAAALNGKTFLNLLTSLGIFPTKQRKGFVHQTKTGTPIAFALISVYTNDKTEQAGTELPIVTLVSDVYGIYNDPFLAPGNYHFLAAHGEHAFPTRLNRPIHLSLKDFYKGEELKVASAKERSALLIPMDELVAIQHKGVWRTKLLLGLNRTLNALQWLVYPFTVLALIAVVIDPNLFNVVIVLIYALILIPKLVRLFRRPVLQGQITMNGNRQPVANVTVTLSTPQGEMVALSKTDKNGKFAFYAPKGEYAVNVISTNLLWNEGQAGTLFTVKANGAQTPIQHFTMSKIGNPFGPI